MRNSKILRQGLFAAATTLALGFGTLEALAAPSAERAPAAYCTAQWAAKCNDICVNRSYDYGTCDGETGACLCWLFPVE